MALKYAEMPLTHGQPTEVRSHDFNSGSAKSPPKASPVNRESSLHAHPRRHHRYLRNLHPYWTALRNPELKPRLPEDKVGAGATHRKITSHRALSGSQDTVVVNRPVDTARYSTFELQADAAVVDELKRQAEREYYEQRDSQGLVRRRSMIRSVSKEDYLLGRGANPRTGLVTPGGGSVDGNIHTIDALVSRNVTPSTKWRQRGDQWISLDIDESTPSTTPLAQANLALPKVRRLRTPERFNQWNSSVPNFALSGRKRSLSGDVAPTMLARDNNTDPLTEPNSVPGSFPESPEKPRSKALNEGRATETVVKRKPIAGVSPGHSFANQPLSQGKQYEQTRALAVNGPHNANRSVSTPSQRKNHHSPADISKELPKLPYQSPSHRTMKVMPDPTQDNKSFLGMRSQTMSNLNQIPVDSPTLGWFAPGKELPCLPMSNGQSRQIHCIDESKQVEIGQPIENHSGNNSLANQRAAAPVSTKSMSRRSHIVEMMIATEETQQNQRSDRKIAQSIDIVPNYDNPPKEALHRTMKPPIGGPRPMPNTYRMIPQELAGGNVPIDPLNITSMNTDIIIPMSYNRGHQQRSNMNNRVRFRTPPPTCGLPPRPHPPRMLPDRRMFVSQDMLGRPQRPHAPHSATNLPLNLCQMNGSQNTLPWNDSQDSPVRIHMGQADRSNMTSMQTEGRMEERNIPIPLPNTHSPTARPPDMVTSNTTALLPTEKQLPTISQTRRCSRCQDGYISNEAPSIGGQMGVELSSRLSAASANAPEVLNIVRSPTPITEVSESCSMGCTSASPARSEAISATIIDVEHDLRDHTFCCPDCCKVDCHGGCLGHARSAQEMMLSVEEAEKNDLRRADSSATCESTSAISSLSSESAERKHKPFSFKSAFRLGFWSRRLSVVSQDTDGDYDAEPNTKTELRPTLRTKSTSPRGSRKADVQNGAVTAARRAIGTGSHAKHEVEAYEPLSVPRKRPTSSETSKTAMSKTTGGKHKDAILTLSSAVPTAKTSALANERRKVSSSRPCSNNHLAVVLHPSQTRTISGCSTDIHIPSIDTIGLAHLSELFFVVPYEAACMWLQNNPQVMGLGWSALESGRVMSCEIAVVGKLLLSAVYVYSKTGKLKLKDDRGNRVSVRDLGIALNDKDSSVPVEVVVVNELVYDYWRKRSWMRTRKA